MSFIPTSPKLPRMRISDDKSFLQRSATRYFREIAVLVALISAAPVSLASTQTQSQDTATGAQSWATENGGVFFSLTQILPQQAEAFYSNRGFELPQIREFTQSCVFMTVLRNDSAASSIHYLREDWSVTVGGKPHRFKKVSEWLEKLEKEGVARSSLIAFQWAQFPPEQEYQPGGDWNQGMLAVGLAPGQRFNITARWEMQGAPFSASLMEVQCAQ